MTASTTTAAPAAVTHWTCPFCPLLCDDLVPVPPQGGGAWQLTGGDCPRALSALAAFDGPPATATPLLDGQPCSLDQALDAAAAVLSASQQPLFGGLGTDVAGGRALYRLACATGAISDAAQGPAMMAALRALQDRGGYTTTMAELRSRADLVVCIGGLPQAAAPRFFVRPVGQPPLTVLQLGGDAPDAAAQPPTQHVPGHSAARGGVLAMLAELAALLAGRAVRQPDAGLAALAAQLQAAHYAVLVAEPGRWQTDAGLVVEAVNRIVSLLNARSRAAALWLGGGDGAATVNQVFGWLSGLPLRSRAGPMGLEHEPIAWDTRRLLADGAVDALLWVASFGPGMAPPDNGLPMVVLGHPRLVLPPRSARTVFIPVATPGIGQFGHLARTDGTVMLPLPAARPDGLPGVAQVVTALADRITPRQEARHG